MAAFGPPEREYRYREYLIMTWDKNLLMLPGVELNTRTALVPILSTTLVGKELMAGNHPWGFIALIFASSCVYASLASRRP